MSFFSKTTTRFDVAVAATAAFLAVFKAFDTHRNYKIDHEAQANKENKK